MGKSRQPLGRVQLEILQYVADRHPVSVGDVAKYFAQTKGKARTTILTVMEKLREKGYLTRKKRQGTYRYSPRQAKSELMANVIERFVEESLGGSVSPFIAYLAKSEQLSRPEITELKNLLRELESQDKEER